MAWTVWYRKGNEPDVWPIQVQIAPCRCGLAVMAYVKGGSVVNVELEAA